jgi:hypothetical protein
MFNIGSGQHMTLGTGYRIAFSPVFNYLVIPVEIFLKISKIQTFGLEMLPNNQ